MTSERRAEVLALEDELERIQLRLAQLANETTAVPGTIHYPGVFEIRQAVHLISTAQLWLLQSTVMETKP